MLGYFLREKVWMENSLSQQEGGWQGRGGSEYRNRLWRVTTHTEATSGCVKEIGRVSGWAMEWLMSNYCAVYICVRGPHVGRYPPHPVCILRTAPTVSPSSLLAQSIFEPNLIPYKYPNILKPSHSSYLPAYEDGTNCFETSVYKI